MMTVNAGPHCRVREDAPRHRSSSVVSIARHSALLAVALVLGACNDDDDRVGDPNAVPILDSRDIVGFCDNISKTRLECGLIAEATYSSDVADCILAFNHKTTWCDHARLARVECQLEMTCDELAAFPADPSRCAAELEEETETCAAE